MVLIQSSTSKLHTKVEEVGASMKKMFGKLATFLNSALGYDDNDTEQAKAGSEK